MAVTAPSTKPNPTNVLRRAPAIPVVLAFWLGVVADAYLPWSGWAWFVVAAGTLLLAGVAQLLRQTVMSVICLLIAVTGTGAVRHHDSWSVGAENDIGLFASGDSKPVRLIGSISQRPIIIESEGDESSRGGRSRERTVIMVRCRQLRDGTNDLDVSGTVRVGISGSANSLQAGDEVELFGRLQLPDEPRNVGEFDYPAFLRRQGIRAVMHCRSPDSVLLRLRPDDVLARLKRFQADMRDRCESLLRKNLNADTTPIAVALLLGSRTRMSPEQREAFVESGTMHVLAISGLNVAILAMFVSGICRLLNVSRGLTAVAILGLVGGYTAITEAGPPVVRAALLVFLAAVGWPWDRPIHSANLLAFTGLGVLLWNPTDAFNAGAHLSFLAVAVILWHVGRPRHSADDATLLRDVAKTSNAVTDVSKPPTLPLEMLHPWLKTWWGRVLRSSVSASREATVLTIFIWLFTAPLIASRFHLVSPIGVLANIPLLPVASITLCLGYLLLLVGLLSPVLAQWVSLLFEPSLRLMLGIVHTAAGFSCGHQYVPTPPIWWLIGTAVLLTTMFWWPSRPLRKHLGWKALWLWTAVGLLLPLLPREPQPLRCTVLAVGHGLAVLIETPSGRTLLYDGGSMGNVRRATDVVQQALWHRGFSRLDGIMLSHADTDHVNGVPGLLRTIPVGRVFISPQFVDWHQPAVRDVLSCSGHCHVPVKLIWHGDSLWLDDEVFCRILHPTANEKLSPDNANSIVLSIEYCGRRILLTGDLEQGGLRSLLQTTPVRADVLLSPHHGSLGANTTDLARWARPTWLIVSGDKRAKLSTLRPRFGPEVRLLSTNDDGAVSFEIDSRGGMSCQTFRHGLLQRDEL